MVVYPANYLNQNLGHFSHKWLITGTQCYYIYIIRDNKKYHNSVIASGLQTNYKIAMDDFRHVGLFYSWFGQVRVLEEIFNFPQNYNVIVILLKDVQIIA